MITQSTLKKMLHYNPDTGDFTRLVSRSNQTRIDDVAGTNVNGYIKIGVNRIIYFAHRLAWLYIHGDFPKNQIDHINHIRDDNRLINLREATHQENQKNRPKQSNNKSGVVGVSRDKRRAMWRSQITINKKDKHLGYFADKFEAICARLSANNKYGFHKNHGMGNLKSILKGGEE